MTRSRAAVFAASIAMGFGLATVAGVHFLKGCLLEDVDLNEEVFGKAIECRLAADALWLALQGDETRGVERVSFTKRLLGFLVGATPRHSRNEEVATYTARLLIRRTKDFHPERSPALVRGARELAVTAWVTENLTAEQMLSTIANAADYGPGVVGVEDAARSYYSRACSELRPAAVVVLARRAVSGSRGESPEALRAARDFLLRRLFETGVIPASVYGVERDTPIDAGADGCAGTP